MTEALHPWVRTRCLVRGDNVDERAIEEGKKPESLERTTK